MTDVMLWKLLKISVPTEPSSGKYVVQVVHVAGVNICPKKSETVYPEIWGILKLSGLINQKIFETVYRNFQTVSKACALILL